ncbi:MAG: HPF/RaiA family ribosome-associated protein [Polyangiales bacterium]
MHVRVRSIHVPLTAAMKQHIETVLSSVRWLNAPQSAVRVRLRDLNGPKGGRDQEALVVGVVGGTTLAARAVDADAYLALSRAIERIDRRARARRARNGAPRSASPRPPSR